MGVRPVRFFRLLLSAPLVLWWGCAQPTPPPETEMALNYDEMIHLDAEELAEGGIARAYEELLPQLREYVEQPAAIEEIADDDAPSYTVRFADKEFDIYGPHLPNEHGESWRRAGYALFTIVNDQLAGSQYRFYALNGGNDLGGMFLTSAQAEAARKTLANKDDWPYLPGVDASKFGR